MADIEVTPLEDGDTLDAASLNTPFTEIETGINDLEEDASRRGAFGSQHLPSLVVAHDSKYVKTDGTTHLYLEAQCDYATFVVLNDNGGLGPGGGDAILRTVFSPTINLASSSTPGIFVRAHLVVQQIKDTAGSPTAHHKRFAVFQIWVRDSDGAYMGLPHTERFVAQRSLTGNGFIHVPITTLITADNTSGDVSDVIDRVEVRIAIHDDAAVGVNLAVVMTHCWLFTTVLHSKL